MSIQLILGPMFSGKTTELFRLLERFSFSERKCLLIKHKGDTRSGDLNLASTHSRLTQNAFAAEFLEEVPARYIEEAHVIGIDEGQFFTDLGKFSLQWTKLGKDVIVAALDGTFEQKMFDPIIELLPKCERVEKLSAICLSCKQEGFFTYRKSNTKELVVIGGSEMYEARCRS